MRSAQRAVPASYHLESLQGDVWNNLSDATAFASLSEAIEFVKQHHLEAWRQGCLRLRDEDGTMSVSAIIEAEPSVPLKDRLACESAAWRQIKAPPGAWCFQEFLLRVGTAGIAQPLPPAYSRMMPNACFQNIAGLVRGSRHLRYCEGFALQQGFWLPIHHAWAIDTEDRVIDPTLVEPERYEFLGFPVSLAVRRKIVTRNSQSVFDTGHGMNFDFMMQHCPALLELVDEAHRSVIDGLLTKNKA